MEKEIEFIMFVGIPASGKSTMAKSYEEKGYTVFSSDAIRAEIEEKVKTGEYEIPSNANLNSVVFDTLQKRAIEALKEGKSVIFDATNLGRKRRMNFKKHLWRIDCKKKLMLFITSVDECKRRNALRKGKARVPNDAMDKMLRNFECPGVWEGWDEIIPVIDSVPYSFDFNSVVGFSQDNPHHTLTLEGHLNSAHAHAVERGFSPTVQKITLYHDIGKVATKKFENRFGEKTEVAHFYGHENYGAYLYLTEKCCGKTPTKEEFEQILYETNLINCHMRPLILWRNDEITKQRDKILFGEQFFTDLVALNECDRFAH